MIKITNRLTIDDSEVEEMFVRSSGTGFRRPCNFASMSGVHRRFPTPFGRRLERLAGG